MHPSLSMWHRTQIEDPLEFGGRYMKKVIWTLGGLCAAAAGFLVIGRKQRAQPVEDLAHRLEEAWADHHTRV